MISRGPVVAAASLAVVLAACSGSTTVPRPAAAVAVDHGIAVEAVLEATVPPDALAGGSPVGGLSGLAWDPSCGQLYAVSDDPGDRGPARFYRMELVPGAAAGPRTGAGIAVLEAVPLRDVDGGLFRRGSVDLEGLALAPDGSLWVASEGSVVRGVPPFIRRYALDGTFLAELELPAYVMPNGTSGIRNNLAFEGVGVTEDGRWLFATIENALLQDGPEASPEDGSPVRILRWDLVEGGGPREFVYLVEAVPDRPTVSGGLTANGVSEIVALERDRLLVLERSYAAGFGNRGRIYLALLDKATDVTGRSSIPPTVVPVRKRQVAAVRDLGIVPDNLEGMCLGPKLEDGRRTLVLISDDNFQPGVQRTQLLVLAVRGLPEAPRVEPSVATIPEIQGEGLLSPLVGRCVAGVRGVVTAVRPTRDGAVAWLQDPQGDARDETSDAVRLRLDPELRLSVGDLVEVDGRVVESGRGVELPVTEIEVSGVLVVASGRTLPEPVPLGQAGRPLPTILGELPVDPFEAADGALGFFESLEGMRVRVDGPVVVGPTSDFGEAVVLPDDGEGFAPRTPRRGLLMSEDRDHPGRVLVDDWLVPDPPLLSVGDRLSEPVIGILDSGFGAWRVLNSEPLRGVIRAGLEAERTTLDGDDAHLTVATCNVENLSAVSDDGRIAAAAETIVAGLGAPDLVALQEIQDDSGPEDDGTVSAAATLARLVEAIADAGGPRYDWRQLDPGDGADGGMPGGNIRVAYLFDPLRVEMVDRGDGGGRDTRVLPGPSLSASPGRLGTASPAFIEDPETRLEGTRKPLVVETRFAGRTLFLVNLHLISKLGDDPQFSRRQPPRRGSEPRRVEQALLVRGFVERLLAADPEAAVVVLGDFNEHEFRAPVKELLAGGLVNLAELLPPEERYTYVFRGLSQSLDHVLVSPSLARGAEVDIVHLNAERPAAERASDHDPIVARLRIPRKGGEVGR